MSRTIAQKTASQITLKNHSRETSFSAQFYILSEQRTSKKSGRHTFKVSKKQTSMYPANQYDLSTWEGKLITEGVTSTGIPGREAFHGHSSLLAHAPFSFIIKADVQLCLIGHKQGVLGSIKLKLTCA